ncbi:GspE/PulE family protein [Labrys wisconsinensis]|uniref:General secretion pathway protein E n=1 Tax=Labrys wisconsinensis TaxID=425677 RepID=A0ABU0JJT9_9HYPH|nr:GspE/PulE family protein [Labrys wisconsinensis]MDQ0473534.1 general secretion pathway protein E [Labrys wisconsinensis]
MAALAETAAESPPLQRLVDHWLDSGALTHDALERGKRAAEASGERLDRALNKLGLVSDDAFVSGWAATSGLPVLTAWPAEPVSVPDLPARFLARAGLLPLGVEDGVLHLAILDPLDQFSLSACAAKTGLTVSPCLARPAELQARLSLIATAEPGAASEGKGLASDIDRLRDLASDAPAVRAVEMLVDRAVELGASDIHILPTVTGARVRVRVDGVLRDLPGWPKELALAVTSRLKVMAGLDIAETRLPQDGRVRLPHRGVEIDLRLATIAQLHGEGVVLRVLHRARATPDLSSLGLPGHVVAGLERIIAAPNGLVLVTGPTGSGKTTTLYATLQRLARPDRNIVTVEDPVEHALEGAAQVQVDRRIGFDFAVALRSVLRHDPDVVMIGEIRDAETASIALRAALTGHLVLATVHTNSALAAIPRLIDMGIEPWLVASTLRATMAQRLVRRLCPACRRPRAAEELALPAGLRCEAVHDAVGCPACEQTGYRGRVSIGEFAACTPRLAEAIARGADERGLAALIPDYRPLARDGFARIETGETSLAEIERVLGDNVAAEASS